MSPCSPILTFPASRAAALQPNIAKARAHAVSVRMPHKCLRIPIPPLIPPQLSVRLGGGQRTPDRQPDSRLPVRRLPRAERETTFPPLTCLEVVGTLVDGCATVYQLRPSVSRAVETDAIEHVLHFEAAAPSPPGAVVGAPEATNVPSSGVSAAAGGAHAFDGVDGGDGLHAPAVAEVQTSMVGGEGGVGAAQAPTSAALALGRCFSAATTSAMPRDTAQRSTLLREALRLVDSVQGELDGTRLASEDLIAAAAAQRRRQTAMALVPLTGRDPGGGHGGRTREDCCAWLQESIARRQEMGLLGLTELMRLEQSM